MIPSRARRRHKGRESASFPASPFRGFTLVELLVVIGIIAVLTAIIFPVFAQTKRRANLTVCTSNVRQLGFAIKLYLQDYDERFPYARTVDSGVGTDHDMSAVPTLKEALVPYVQNDQLWFCPSWMAEHGDLFSDERSLWRAYDSTYGYNAFPTDPAGTLFGKSYSEVRRPEAKPMVWCASGSAHSSLTPKEWTNGAVGVVNVCYVDGHVKLHRGTLRQFTDAVHAAP